MKHTANFIIILVLMLCSCTFIARRVHNVKQAKAENPASIKKWLQREHIYMDKILTVPPDNYYLLALNYSQGPFLFNRKGEFISVGYNNDGRFCPKGVDEFLKTMTRGFEKNDPGLSNYILRLLNNLPDTLFPSLEYFYSACRDINGETLPVFTGSAYDYTLVLSFSLFYGNTIQTKKMRTFIKAITQNRNVTIDIILLNFDKQQWWGQPWIDNIHIIV